ncbi:MAG TPA: ATP-binding domain-containing protein, partial [Acidimicrobiia bacterium]|nr:ATP-binding domain-containing protein [Acidimicrobiia bacterium]
PLATLKGDARMAQVIARAAADRERPLRADATFLLDGLRIRFSRRDSARVVTQARRRRGTHNAKRLFLERRVLDVLVERYHGAATRSYRASRLDAEQRGDPDGGELTLATVDPAIASALARGESPPEDWSAELRTRLRRRPEVHEILERIWPVLSGAELVNDLFGFRALVRSAAEGILAESEQELLHRARRSELDDAPWTDADVALVDEADALLGPVEDARPRRRVRHVDQDALDSASAVIDELGLHGLTDAATLAQRYADPGSSNGDGRSEPRTFGHVLVDEAQDLTAMQWRMLARRCPSGSMTLVGDPGQASRPGALAAWSDILAHIPRQVPPRFANLTVNYRTPAEIMDVANRLLAVAAPTVVPSASVRRVGIAPEFLAVANDARVRAAAHRVRAARAKTGTVAVIAPRALHDAFVAELADLGAVADTVEALDAPVAVLDATDAKGLEFDHVVVVEPARLVAPDRSGLRLLYVTITRATKTLTVVHSEPLPEALVNVSR